MEQDEKKITIWKKILNWIKKHLIAVIAISVSLLICLGIIISAAVNADKIASQQVAPTVTKQKTVKKIYSPLSGLEVASEADTKSPVTGMMVENSLEARPQSGLKKSGVVFEAIAEGGITRFLVLYQNEKPSLIGPVRSLRLYDVDWLAAFDAGIGHVGGSAMALSEIRNGQYRDLDQFFNSQYYWRASDRYAPHNVYTNFEKIDAMNASKNIKSSKFTGFSRVDGKVSANKDATSINVVVSSYSFNSSYVYDETSNTYLRSQGGGAHLDREDGQISPSAVVTLHVEETTIMEDGSRENIKTIGSGDAEIFQNGTVIKGTWHKSSKLGQLSFTDADGNDVPLVRGQTWITAVPIDGGSVTWE